MPKIKTPTAPEKLSRVRTWIYVVPAVDAAIVRRSRDQLLTAGQYVERLVLADCAAEAKLSANQ